MKLVPLIAIGCLIAVSASAQVPTTGAGKGAPGGAVTAGPIITPIFAAGSTTAAPTNGTTTTYVGMAGSESGNLWISTLTSRIYPVPIPGFFAGIEVNAPSLSSWTGGSNAFSINASASSGASPSCSLSSANPTACSDTAGCTTLGTCTNKLTVAAGANVAIQSIPATPLYTNTTPAPFQISTAFVGTNNNESLIFLGGAGNQLTASASYAGVGTSWGATENLQSFVMPSAGTLDSLYVVLNAAPTSTANYVYTIWKNGQAAANSPTCTISGAATSCNDIAGCAASTACTTHNVPVAAGDMISLQSCPSTATPGSPNANCTNTTNSLVPTARIGNAGLRFLPSVPFQSVVIATPTPLPPVTASTTRFDLFSGSGSYADTTNTTDQNVIPYTGTTPQTYGNFLVVGCYTSAAGTRLLQMQANGATQANPQVTLPAGTVSCPSVGSGWSTSGQDTSHTYAVAGSVANAQTFNFIHTVGASAAAVLTIFKQALTVVVH